MKEVLATTVKDNVIDEFKNKVALVTARKKDGSFNMCTIAWGSIGEIWSKEIVTVYVKPIRFTDSFLKEDDYFTVSFMDDSLRDDVMYCGTHSGKDVDKIKNTNLKPIVLENGITFEGFRRVYVCKKIYQGQFKLDEFVDGQTVIDKYYKAEDPHNIYLGEILKVLEQ